MQDSQNSIKKLYDINKQMASTMKIQNSFEDSSIYVDTMRLNYEITTLDQVMETSSKAQTFAKNTDSTLNQFTTSLDTFKTKLIQASNASNSSTSLNAIANDLESLKTNLINLGNTSINGQFLFSGTSLLQKPLNADGTYVGNGENLDALIGSGVTLPYNIDGQSLFLGKDSDYNRIVSTNVPMYNQTKLHPDIMIDGADISSASEVYLKDTDTIRDMTGDNDNNSANNPQSVFYLSGRKSDGTTFSSKIPIDSSSKISDLLESIGKEYGNTTTNKVVDVTMNAHGQIELKDLKTGNQLLEMNLFGAIDRDAATGTVGNANQTDIDSLMAQPNVDIISFHKSDFATVNATSTIASRKDPYTADLYRIGYPMYDVDGNAVKTTTTLSSFMPSGATSITVGASTLSIIATTTVQDLMNTINTVLPGATIRLENGQMIVDDPSNATNISVNSVGATAFAIPDEMNYTRRGFEKDGNGLTSNVSQNLKDNTGYATAQTKLVEVAGVGSLDAKNLSLAYVDKNGVSRNASINLSNLGSTFSIDLNNDGFTTGINENFSIFDANGNATKADEVTYQQLTDIISMATSGILPTDGAPLNLPIGTNPGAGDSSINAIEYNYAINSAKANVEVTLDYKGRLSILDKTASTSKIEFSLFDSQSDTFNGSASAALSFMANDAVTISNPSIDFFKDLDSMIEAVRSGNFRMDDKSTDPRNIGIQNSISQLDHILDHVTKEQTKIGAFTNALTNASDRAEYLSLNVKSVRSSVIDVDVAEAYLQFTTVSTSYQAMLSTISKINSMSLLNYM